MRCSPILIPACLGIGMLAATVARGEGAGAGDAPEPARLDTVRVVLAVHHDPAYDDLPRARLSRGALPLPSGAGSLNPSIPADGESHRWVLLAVFDPPHSACSRVNAIAFGWSGDGEEVHVTAAGPCDPSGDPLELKNPGWPRDGGGVGVAYLADREPVDPENTLQPLYWFESSATGPGEIRLVPHEAQGIALLLRRSTELQSELLLPVLGVGRPGTTPPAVPLYTGQEPPPEREDAIAETTGETAAIEAPPLPAARRTFPPAPMRYGLLSGTSDREPRPTLEGAADEVRVLAYLDSLVPMWQVDDRRFIEVLSTHPIVIGATSNAPEPRLPGEPGLIGGPGLPDGPGLSGERPARRALAVWTLYPAPAGESGPWNLRLSAADTEDSLDAAFERSGMPYRCRLGGPGR